MENIGYQIAVVDGRTELAKRILHELVNHLERVAELSGVSQLGTEASELGVGVRLIAHRRWVVLFRYIEDGILVLRIADGRQDYLAWKL